MESSHNIGIVDQLLLKTILINACTYHIQSIDKLDGIAKQLIKNIYFTSKVYLQVV